MCACSFKKCEIVEILLEEPSRVNIEFQTAGGTTSLMKASSHGCIKIVKSLLNAGANVHAKNNNGWTALMYACVNLEPNVVRLLLKYGATIAENMDETNLEMRAMVCKRYEDNLDAQEYREIVKLLAPVIKNWKIGDTRSLKKELDEALRLLSNVNKKLTSIKKIV